MITSADVENELNPQGIATKFKYASNTSATDRAILDATATVRASTPEEYRRMFGTITGLVLTREAMEGEVEFDLPSWLVPTAAYVWVNHVGTYRDRKRVDCVDATLSAGKITLSEALDEDDVVVADFVIAAADVFTPQLLKGFALRSCCNTLRRVISSLVAESDRASLDQDLIFLREDLKQLRKRDLRIDEWDELDLVDEAETITPGGPGVISADGW